jgi:hypothetical protein
MKHINYELFEYLSRQVFETEKAWRNGAAFWLMIKRHEVLNLAIDPEDSLHYSKAYSGLAWWVHNEILAKFERAVTTYVYLQKI